MNLGAGLLERRRPRTRRSKRRQVWSNVWSIATATAIALGFVLAGSTAQASAPDGRVAIALIGPETIVVPIREVVDELLAREDVAITWSRPRQFLVEDVLAPATSGDRTPISVWIDLTPETEARLTFRDASAERFIVRRLAVRRGAEQIAAEEIAQVVKSVVLAIGAGTPPALTRSEARAVLQPAPVRIEPAALPVPRRTLETELGAAAVGQMFAPEVPISGRFEVAVAVLSRGPSAEPGAAVGAAVGAVGAWIAAGHALPVHYSGPIAIDLSTATLRAGLLAERPLAGAVSVRAGLGGGVDWVRFEPRASSSGVTPSGEGGFVTPYATLAGALVLRPQRALSLAVGVVVDVAAASVHYDVRDSQGTLAQVLVPYRLRAGLALSASWRL